MELEKKILLEEVFKLSGLPTHTFVKPAEYERLLVALRTPGRGVVVEGPSGIGKTTAVLRALDELGWGAGALRLSARKEDDKELIAALPSMRDAGLVIVDDFHRLPAPIKGALADFIKILADEEREDTKLVVIGITRAGQSLLRFGADVATRLDVIPFEANPDERVRQVPVLGQAALNIELNTCDEIVDAASGSFFIAQLLCHHSCLASGVDERSRHKKIIETSFELTRSRVLGQLAPKFSEVTRKFASGPKLRREGRAPYLHILKWLAEANEWTVDLDRAIATHPEQRAGVGQVVDKGYLESFLFSNADFEEVLHYDSTTRVLAAQDPQFVFFLRNLPWNEFAMHVGYLNTNFDSRYDIALSFAGRDREVAEKLFDKLSEHEFAVFYDRNEQHRILAEDVEEYLGPIYRSEAELVVCLLSATYPERVWAKFESDQFRERFGDGAVVPVWFTDAPPGRFDESRRVGGLSFDPGGDLATQVAELAETLRRKVLDLRSSE